MWHFTAWRGAQSWIGLAKREPFENGHPIYEPGEVHFELGDTAEDVKFPSWNLGQNVEVQPRLILPVLTFFETRCQKSVF